MIKKIYLIGNPNVGKSVVFSRLTGVQVISSNYPGTTVEISNGYLNLYQERECKDHWLFLTVLCGFFRQFVQ